MWRGALLAGFATIVIAPHAVESQMVAKIYRIAIVVPSGAVVGLTETGHPAFRVLFQELRRLGYVEGANLRVDRRSANGRTEQYRELAREVVGIQPDVIYTIGTRMALAFREATTTIPVVAFTGDPIAAGLVESLAKPGGNLTGFSDDAGLEVLGKRLELLRQAVPGASRVAVLVPRGALREAAPRLAATLLDGTLGDALGEAEYRRAFATMVRERADALFVADHLENFTHRRLIVELATQARLPAVYAWRDAAEAGGLIAYGIHFGDIYRGVADYINRILSGTPPAELPYQQPPKFELVINLKTAKGPCPE